MSPPTFSVVMPAYGTEAYVGQAIESVLAQSRSDWELVVVDDGSPDNLVERVHPYLSDPRIRLIRQPNAGPAAALNRGAAATHAPYLVRLDSDDFLLSGYLEAVAGAFSDHPGVGLVACDAFVLDERRGRLLRRTYARAYKRDIYRRDGRLARLLTANFILTVTTIRRTAFDSVGGYDVDPHVVEDWDLWLRIVAAGIDLQIVDRPLAVYRLRFPSLSRDESGADRLGPRVERTLNKALAEFDLSREEQLAARRSLECFRANAKIGQARCALLSGDVRTARQLARDAWSLRPTPRTAAVLGGLWVAPGVLRVVHRSKTAVIGMLRTRRRRTPT